MLRVVPIGGFLGAGKTTTMMAAAAELEAKGEIVSIITNDQGNELVDTQMAKTTSVASVSEVTGGCFCCRFEDLASTIMQIMETTNPTVVLAEAVGSCTDLQSTVVRPMKAIYKDKLSVAPLVILLDPFRYSGISSSWSDGSVESDLAYLYRHQLDEADIIVINKIDILSDGGHELIKHVQEKFPHAHVMPLSAKTGKGISQLTDIWLTDGAANSKHRAFEIDYERYGAAEAELAWTNQTFKSIAQEDKFNPKRWADTFLRELCDSLNRQDAMIGHVKIRGETIDGAIKASITVDSMPTYDEYHNLEVQTVIWTLNARVAIATDALEQAIDSSILAADIDEHSDTEKISGSIFNPGFPVPVYRM